MSLRLAVAQDQRPIARSVLKQRTSWSAAEILLYPKPRRRRVIGRLTGPGGPASLIDVTVAGEILWVLGRETRPSSGGCRLTAIASHTLVSYGYCCGGCHPCARPGPPPSVCLRDSVDGHFPMSRFCYPPRPFDCCYLQNAYSPHCPRLLLRFGDLPTILRPIPRRLLEGMKKEKKRLKCDKIE